VEDLVKELLQSEELEVLSKKKIGKALQQFVEKDEKDAVAKLVQWQIDTTTTEMMKRRNKPESADAGARDDGTDAEIRQAGGGGALKSEVAGPSDDDDSDEHDLDMGYLDIGYIRGAAAAAAGASKASEKAAGKGKGKEKGGGSAANAPLPSKRGRSGRSVAPKTYAPETDDEDIENDESDDSFGASLRGGRSGGGRSDPEVIDDSDDDDGSEEEEVQPRSKRRKMAAVKKPAKATRKRAGR
jgi:double-strand break repair protein MRE11